MGSGNLYSICYRQIHTCKIHVLNEIIMFCYISKNIVKLEMMYVGRGGMLNHAQNATNAFSLDL